MGKRMVCIPLKCFRNRRLDLHLDLIEIPTLATRPQCFIYHHLSLITIGPRLSIQFNSIQFNSIQFNSIQFNSIQFNSIQFNSIQFNPIQSNPIQSNPIQSNPIQSNPIQFNSIQLQYFYCPSHGKFSYGVRNCIVVKECYTTSIKDQT